VNQEYTVSVMISIGLLALFIILPFVSKGYGEIIHTNVSFPGAFIYNWC